MALSSATYTGDAATTNFTFDKGYILASDVLVYLDGVLQTVTTDYIWFTSSTVQFLTAPAGGVAILFQRRTENDARLVDFQDAGNLTEADLDLSANQLFYLMQEAQDDFTANAMVLDTDTKWDGASHVIKDVADPTNLQDAATVAYGDANWGGTAADAAAASAAAALVTEAACDADLVLTNADVVLTGADLVLTNADVISAEAARVAAVNAQVAAELALDTFDDRFLGNKASAPTLDNDGDALANGALYWNSTEDVMYVYDSGWVIWAGNYLLITGGTMTGDISFKTATFTENDEGNSGTALTIDWTLGNKSRATLTGNATFTFTAPAGATNLLLVLVQDATGSRTITWPANVKWPSGTPAVLTTTANAIDIVTLYYDGTDYYAAFGLDYS